FGFQKRLVVPDGKGGVAHSELSMGPGVIMVSTSKPEEGRASPRNGPTVGGGICVRVDDPDACLARAKAAGARITRDIHDEEYGSRGFSAKDPEGHDWYFGTYLPGSYWEA
ncbi:MAG: VOC family protein, partial [Planctomycetota bacterium]